MNQNAGSLIVIEGSDGSGKTTQFKLLAERLKAAGYDVAVFEFPRYDKTSSHFIKQYLNGNYGSATKVSPYTASLFYALDRYEASKDIRLALQAGKVVLCDRYVGSNMAHQGAKFDDVAEQRGFFVWEDNLEFQLLDIPRPDTNLFLRVPADVSYELMQNQSREKRNYTSSVRDEHEADIEFMKKSVATFDLLCKLFPKDFQAIECSKNDHLLSIPEISNLIWQRIQPLLPAVKPHNGHRTVVKLGEAVSQPVQQPVKQSGDKLVHTFKNASLFLKLQIEHQVKSVDPSGSMTWSDSDYRYFMPIGLQKDVKAVYDQSLVKIADLHKRMRQSLESYYKKHLLSAQDTSKLVNISEILLPVTPLAAACDFTVELSNTAVERLCAELLANDSPELQWAAQQLYLSARQTWPSRFSKPLESANNPEPLNNIIAKLSENKLSLNSSNNSPVKLLEALPRQEFDLLAESIYPYSSLSLDEISNEVSDWSYQQKYESLKQAAASPSILEKVKYKFDIVSDQTVMSEILHAAHVNNLQLQSPSPRYGYDVPLILEDIGIEELFLECFDESLKLYSVLQHADRDDLMMYAALLGHKLRWQMNTDAKNMKQIFERHGNPAYQLLAETIKQTVSEAHPLIWDVLANIRSTNLIGSKPRRNRVKPQNRRKSKPKSPFKNKD